jgi:hypothetical protein
LRTMGGRLSPIGRDCVQDRIIFQIFHFFLSPSLFQTGLVSELDANNLLPLLECVPDSAPSPLLTSWLAQNAVPFLLQHVPQALVREYKHKAVVFRSYM